MGGFSSPPFIMKLIYLLGFICFPPDAYNPEPICTTIQQRYETVSDCIKYGNELNIILKEEQIKDYHFRCKEYDSNNKNY